MGDKAKPTKDETKSREIQPTLAFDSGQDTSPQSSGNSATIPEMFGRYRIVRTLGQGAMGSVHLAHDTQLDRKVALKIPKFSQSGNATIIERFYKEAKSAATLDHPNICSVYDVGEITGVHYIAMAYVQGQSLADYVNPAVPPSPRSIVRVVRKIALALYEAHSHGVIHRDLKPANIMVDQRKEPIVMDFGLARQADQSEDSRLTQAGTIVGTPAYMSPEQLEGDPARIGPACDIYSLGVLLYELLTGELPFPGSGSVMSIIGEVFSKPPPSPLSKRADIDSRLADICVKAMAKDPQERFESMKSFADELTRFLSKSKRPSQPQVGLPGSPSLISIRADEQRKLVQTLCSEKQYRAAETILAKMAADTNPDEANSAKWARQELSVVQSLARDPTGVDLAVDNSLFEDDLLANEATAESPAFTPTSASRPAADDQSIPKWLYWVIPVPVVVLVLLFGFIATRSWMTPGDADLAGNPDAEVVNAGTSALEPAGGAEPVADDSGDNEADDDDSADDDDEFDRPRRLAALLASFDTDDDGEISYDEIPRHDLVHFAFLDTDDDDALDVEELKNYLRIGRAVENRSAEIEEIVARELEFDDDADGELDADELAPYVRHLMRAADTNKNSRLDEDELRALVTESMRGGPGRGPPFGKLPNRPPRPDLLPGGGPPRPRK